MALSSTAHNTITAKITTTPTTLYTGPIGYDSVVTFAQITNVTSTPIEVTLLYCKAYVNDCTEILSNFLIPGNDSISIINGDRLSVGVNDSIQAVTTTNDALKIVMSVQAAFDNG